MTKHAVRIGLVSPYSGTNLGDQAVQSATIGNLRARAPGAEITGIYLNTWRPARIHDVRTFPITGLAVPFYSNVEELFGKEPSQAERTTAPAKPVDADDGPRGWRDALKRVPGVRAGVLGLRAVAGAVRSVFTELRWLVRAWRFVGQLDLVVIAGSGQICDTWGGALGQPYSMARWACLAKLRGRRFAIMSVGASRLQGWLSRRLTAFAVRRADYLSCRDPESIALVRELVPGSDPRMVYDLASTLPALEAARNPAAAAKTVAISPMSFGRVGSWPNEAQDLYQRYIRALSGLTLALGRDGWNITLFMTSGADGRALTELIEMVRAEEPAIAEGFKVVRPPTLAQLFDAISPCRLVVASRLHGVILSHLLEKPVLAISFDPKVDSHITQFGQEDFRLDIGNVDAPTLQARFAALEQAAESVTEAVRRARESYAPDVLKQYDRLIELARGSA
jgi:polysaccharide pyruvyl transferase WcaK-like protein